jgi:hypothetical protein
MATTYAPSPKAVAYAKSLTAQVNEGNDNLPEILLAMDDMSAKQIGAVIDVLKPLVAAAKFTAAKVAQPTTELPAGKYGVEGIDGTIMVFSIDKPTTGKWAGWTFVNKLEGKNRTPVRDRDEKQAVLDEIEAAGYLQSAKLYGKATGRCSICDRELTDPNSIAAGIGPICATKF